MARKDVLRNQVDVMGEGLIPDDVSQHYGLYIIDELVSVVLWGNNHFPEWHGFPEKESRWGWM